MKIIEDLKNKFSKDGTRRWHKFYPKDKRSVKVPNVSLYEYLYNENKNHQDMIAINYFNRLITYKELFKSIDLCAKALRSQGIREGDVVSICLPNIPEAVISFYAVSKIGAIANMIHPLSAEAEIKQSLVATKSVMLIAINLAYKNIKDIIEDTNVYKSVIVSAKDSMPTAMSLGYYLLEDRKINIPRSNEKFIYWKDFMTKGVRYNAQVMVSSDKDKCAVILHSGGTTGVPKNIMLSNGNLNVVVEQARIALPELGRGDKFLSILPMFHCFGLVECIHYPLCNGETVILIPKFDASRFDKLLTKYNPTVIPGVPTLFEALVNNKYMDNVDLSDVKYVVSGGDCLNEEKNKIVNGFLRGHGCQHNIIQGYGMTESCGGFVFGALGSDILGSVGIPLPSNDMKIIDIDTHKELGPNETGEILLSGPPVMMGYLDNPEETNQVLEKDSDGKVWVHTGDAGYYNEDGVLFFQQRIKRLIIVSGYNVFPSHIEEVLQEHPAVKDVCVIGVPHPYKLQVPKAYIVLNEGYHESAVILRELRQYCEKNLAKYMLPKEYVFKDSLPKTMVGKVDFKKLEKEHAEEQKKKDE